MQNVLVYEDVSLKSYCKSHDICYSSKLRMIKKLVSQNTSKTISEIIKEVMETSRNIYFYDNMSLKEYCEIHNLNYNTIFKRISRLKSQNPTLSNDEICKIALNQESWTKYYYGSETLYSFCKRNNFNIDDVTKRIKRLINNNPNMSLESAIKETVKYYEYKRYSQNVTKIFKYLKTVNSSDDKYIKEITDYLNIDFTSFMFLLNKYHFKVITAVALIWYFHDNEFNRKLSISNKRIKEILLYIKNLENNKFQDIESLDLGYLLGIYKTGLFDTRHLIILQEERFIYYTIYKLQNELNMKLDRDTITDVYNEVGIYLLEILEKIDSNIPAKFIYYITKSLKGYIYDYLLKLRDNRQDLSLEAEPLNKKCLKDNIQEDRNSNNFSVDTLAFLDDFDDITKNFIIWRYQEGKDHESIANILGISVEETITFEKSLLLKLRNDPSVKEFFGIYLR